MPYKARAWCQLASFHALRSLLNNQILRAQGAAFLTQTVALDDYIVKFEIWDTAGQERYRSLAPMYYRGAAAALVVYDITDHVGALLPRSRYC